MVSHIFQDFSPFFPFASSSPATQLTFGTSFTTHHPLESFQIVPPYPPPNFNEAEINGDGLDDDFSLAEALHTGSPFPPEEDAYSNSVKYNYSVSLRSEPKVRGVIGLPRTHHSTA